MKSKKNLPFDTDYNHRQKIKYRRSKTEIGKKKEALMLNKDRFRDLVETTSDWIWEIDANGVYTYVSPKVTDLLGYTVEEVLGKTPFDLMPPDEADRIALVMKPLFVKTQTIMNLENINIHKNGHLVILETSGVPIFDSLGNLAGYRGIDRNITERKRMEEALRESEEKYRSLLEHAYDAIMIADFDGHILEINEKAEQLTGYTKEELIDSNISGLHPEEERERALRAFREMKEGTMRVLLNTKLLRKDGESVSVDISGGVIAFGSKKVVQGICRDITDRKNIEEALAKSEQRFRSLSEASLEAIVFIKDGVITDANTALNRLFGYEGEDLRGKLATDFIVQEKRPFTDERMRTRTIGSYETFGLRKDGSTFPIEVNAREFEYDGSRLRISAVRDLTEYKKVEKQLKDYQFHLERLVEERAEELKKSEKKYRSIFENAIEGIYQSTPEGHFLSANPALAKIFGYESPTIFLKSITNIALQIYTSPERRTEFLRLIEKDGFVQNFEIEARMPDGSVRYASMNTRAVKDENGKTLFYEGMVQDITEKKQAYDQILMQRNLALNLARIDNLEEGLGVILQTALEESKMECGGILLRSPVSQSFDLVFSTGLREDFKKQVRSVSPGMSTYNRLLQGKSYHASPCKEHTPIAFDEGFKHISIAPILNKEEVIGSLVVASHFIEEIPKQIQVSLEFLAAELGNIIVRMQARQQLEEEMAIRKKTEKSLDAERRNLEEANTALKVLLKCREDDKKEMEKRFVTNVQQLVMPYIEKLKSSKLESLQQASLSVLESNLNEIVTPFLDNIKHFNFTPRQLEIIDLIKDGRSTKEIANLLAVGKDAIDMQRLLIRKKLGLNNKKINLWSYLRSLS